MDSLAAIETVEKSPEHSFSILYQDQRLGLVAYATALMAGDRAGAEDAVDDAFADFWQAEDCKVGLNSEIAWIKRLVRNKAIDRLRKDKRLEFRSDDAHCSAQICPQMNPEECAQAKDQSAWLKHSLSALSVDQREAIVLCYFEGLSLQEIAQQTGAPWAL